jgi:uncharacterized membrane protein (GlpM family)
MISLYFEFLIPFILSALVVIAISLIAERYGTKTGGIIGTLPSTILVAYLFIAYNEGVNVASKSVAVVAAEMGVNVIFLLLFSLYAHRSLTRALAISFGSWTILSALLFLFNVDNIFISLGVFVLFFIIAFVSLEYIKKIPSVRITPASHTLGHILLRGFFAGIVIAVAVFLSNLGAVLSGIFSAFPVIFLSTMVISVREQGPTFAGGMAKAMIFGSPSVVCYAVSIYFLYPTIGILSGTLCAFVLSFLLTFLLFMVGKKLR